MILVASYTVGSFETRYSERVSDLNISSIAKALIKSGLDLNPKLDKNYTLTLPLDKKWLEVHEFISHAKKLKLGDIHKLKMKVMSDFSPVGNTDINNSLSFFPHNLQVLELNDTLGMDILVYKQCLPALLQSVHHQIFIDHFTLEKDALRMIFENCTIAKELVLYHCKVGDFDHFEIDKTFKTNLHILDLFGTCKKTKHGLNPQKLSLLVPALSNTKLKKSLKTIHVNEEEYEKEALEDLFGIYDFHLKIVADDKAPVAAD